MSGLIETSSSLDTSATEQNSKGLPTGNAGVPLSVYESAVSGRRAFRDAYRAERAKVEDLAIALEEARDALNGAPNTEGLHNQINDALRNARLLPSSVSATANSQVGTPATETRLTE